MIFNKFNRVYRDISSPSPPSLLNASCMYVCMCVCIYICIYIHVYICDYIHVGILYLNVLNCVCSLSSLCQFIRLLCMCMYVRIIVCSFYNIYLSVQHKYIFVIDLNSYTCPHTLSMDVMWAHVYWRQWLRAFGIQMCGFEHLAFRCVTWRVYMCDVSHLRILPQQQLEEQQQKIEEQQQKITEQQQKTEEQSQLQAVADVAAHALLSVAPPVSFLSTFICIHVCMHPYLWMYIYVCILYQYVFTYVYYVSQTCTHIQICMWSVLITVELRSNRMSVLLTCWSRKRQQNSRRSSCRITRRYVCVFIYAGLKWLIHMRNMTYHVRTWLHHVCDTPHSSVWHDRVICVTWHIHLYGLSQMCIMWLIHMQNVQDGEAPDSPVFGSNDEDDDDEPIQPMGDAPDLGQEV